MDQLGMSSTNEKPWISKSSQLGTKKYKHKCMTVNMQKIGDKEKVLTVFKEKEGSPTKNDNTGTKISRVQDSEDRYWAKNNSQPYIAKKPAVFSHNESKNANIYK